MCSIMQWNNSPHLLPQRRKSSSSDRSPDCGECLLFSNVCYVWHNKAGPEQKWLRISHLTPIIFLQSTQNEKLWTYAKYLYDGLGHRVRLMEVGTYENTTFTYDGLLLFREVTAAMTRTSQIFIKKDNTKKHSTHCRSNVAMIRVAISAFVSKSVCEYVSTFYVDLANNPHELWPFGYHINKTIVFN